MSAQLPLHQQVLLLALNDRTGTFCHGLYLYSVAGAMVSELLLQRRIVRGEGKDGDVSVANMEATGDELLDELLQMIQSSKKPRSLSHWVRQTAGLKDLPHRVAHQLSEKGVVKEDKKKFLWVFTQRIYPEIDGTFEDDIRQRMANIMFDESTVPDGQTAVLIALARHASLLKPNFPAVELQQHKERINSLANGDVLASDATKETIKAVQAAILVATVVPAIVASTMAQKN
ncbi:MAG: GPP34 family phosphoprotein [Fuerstiella sp.]